MKRKSWELKLIFLVLVAVFAVFLAVPAIRLLLKSFLGEDGLTGAYYLDVFSGKGFTTALGNSFAVSIVIGPGGGGHRLRHGLHRSTTPACPGGL